MVFLGKIDPEDQDPDGTRMDMGYGYAAQGPVVNFSSQVISNTSIERCYLRLVNG